MQLQHGVTIIPYVALKRVVYAVLCGIRFRKILVRVCVVVVVVVVVMVVVVVVEYALSCMLTNIRLSCRTFAKHWHRRIPSGHERRHAEQRFHCA